MTAPGVLLALAGLLALFGGRLLGAASWPMRAPRLGVLAWQALTLAVVLSVVLAGLALALPSLPLTADLASLLDACAVALKLHYSTPGGASAALVGAVIAVAVVVRTVASFAAELVALRQARDRHRRSLRLVSGEPGDGSLVVVEDERAAAYCVPGRQPSIVLTRGALTCLEPDELAVVLEHERAHLRGRHDVAVVAAIAACRAFPFVPLFRVAPDKIRALLEMHADDAAARGEDRPILASAMVRLAEGASPRGALAVGADAVVTRVHRLLEPANPLGTVRMVLTAGVIVGLAVMPVGVAVAPGVEAVLMHYCPVVFPQ